MILSQPQPQLYQRPPSSSSGNKSVDSALRPQDFFTGLPASKVPEPLSSEEETGVVESNNVMAVESDASGGGNEAMGEEDGRFRKIFKSHQNLFRSVHFRH